MQIQAAESLLAVYETRNISRACEKLFITQQCLSQRIKGLEAELGVTLFIRQKTGMQPTAVCSQMIPELRDMLGHYHNIRRICADHGDASRLTLVLANGMSNYIDVSSLSSLTKEFCEKELIIEERQGEECCGMLLNGEADMAFLLEPFDDTMLEHTLIREDRGCVAIHKNHALARSSGPLPLSALNGLNTVMGVSTSCVTEHFKRYCAQSNVHPRGVASVANITGFINSLHQDDLAVMLLSASLPLINNPDVVVREVTAPVLLGKCHCCFRSDSKNAALLRGLMIRIRELYAPS